MKAAVVGYGAVGPVHAHAIHELVSAELYAVCDINKERTTLSRQEYGCIIYNNYKEVLKDSNIDVVHICTPHYLHFDMTMKALEAGKHVVLEKPVGIHMSEMEQLMNYTKMHPQQKVCVMLQNRRNVCVEKLKDIAIGDVKTGRLKGILGNVYWKRDESYYAQDPWRGKWRSEGGGVLINQALHMIDMMIYFGGRIRDVKSMIAHWEITNIEVEDDAKAILYFENGTKGVFQATNNYVRDEPYNLELLFENAHYRYADGRLYEIRAKDVKILAFDESVQVGKEYWGTGHKTVIRDFYNVLTGNEGQYTDVRDAYETMKTIFTIYNQAEGQLK